MGGSITEGTPPAKHPAEKKHEKQFPCPGKFLYMSEEWA